MVSGIKLELVVCKTCVLLAGFYVNLLTVDFILKISHSGPCVTVLTHSERFMKFGSWARTRGNGNVPLLSLVPSLIIIIMNDYYYSLVATPRGLRPFSWLCT